jgi:hypothetical protein
VILFCKFGFEERAVLWKSLVLKLMESILATLVMRPMLGC